MRHTSISSSFAFRALSTSANTPPSTPPPPSFELTPTEYFLKHLKQCHSVSELEQLVLNSPLECFDAENVTRATSGLGQLKSSNQKAITKVLDLASTGKLVFPPLFLTHICHGIDHGKLAKRVPAELVRQVSSDLTRFSNDQLFTLLYCFSNRETDNAQLCQSFYHEITSTNNNSTRGGVSEFEDADFAIVLESFAKWRFPLKDTEIGQAMVRELTTRPLGNFTTMELSIILERLEYKDPAFFEHFQKELAKRTDYDALADNRFFESDEDDDDEDDDDEDDDDDDDDIGDEDDDDDDDDFESIVVDESDLEDEDFDEDEDVTAEEEDDAEKAEDDVIAPPKTMIAPAEGEGEEVPKDFKPNFRRFRRRLT